MEHSKELVTQIFNKTEKSVNTLLSAISAETTQEIAKYLLIASFMLSFSRENEIRELSDTLTHDVASILRRNGYTKDFLVETFYRQEESHA